MLGRRSISSSLTCMSAALVFSGSLADGLEVAIGACVPGQEKG